jgi:TRAP-type uncharacterized transport system substrate-binding protein
MRRATILLSILLATSTSTLTGFASAVSAKDARLSIASGVSGGTYRGVYAADLENQLSDYTVIHRLSSGSGENLEMLANGRAAFGFAQADVYALRLAADPGHLDSLIVLGRLGVECLFIAVRKEGPIHALAELEALIGNRPPEIAIGPPQAGANGTWQHLALLSPGLAKAIAHPVGDRMALRYLERGTFDAVVWVTDPSNFDHRMLRAVRESARLELLEVSDDTFTATLPDGSQVYEIGQVRLEKNGPPIQTICTDAILLSGSDTDPAAMKRAQRMRGLRQVSESSD